MKKIAPFYFVLLSGCTDLGATKALQFSEPVTIGGAIVQVEWSRTATGIYALSSDQQAAKIVALRECATQGDVERLFSAPIDNTNATQWACKPLVAPKT